MDSVRLDYYDSADAAAVALLLREHGHTFVSTINGGYSVLVHVDDVHTFDLRIARRVAEAYAIVPTRESS